MKSLKIVHCGIFNEKTSGKEFYSQDRKISHGLHQNGHFVYDFSYRDVERGLRKFGLKNLSTKKMNQKLIQICKNLNADLLLLGKAEKIEPSTIQSIKNELPNIKIALWYVDHLEESQAWFDKLKLIDLFFYANALNLQKLSSKYPNAIFSFFPNISDEAFDLSLNLEKNIDIIYIARDYKEDVRFKFATMLDEFCKQNDIKHKIYASLGNPPIFGYEFAKAINSAKIAINFNRDDELECTKSNKLLGASDRMAQFMGCGTCTFSPRINGFEKFFTDGKDIVYFDNPQDCFDKIKEYLKDNKFKQIAKNGRDATLNLANAKKVTKFMVETLALGGGLSKFSQDYEWREFMFKNGDKI
ncbi:glycosyltransferase, family 1 [Campylobacter iguaniorum]|uniref:glycosyltransferase family protein n=1 Tax=Campylobacter iguaniorum TaxID=1244531 RepID=UPI0007C9883B|nr:glycosyltransferase [Campylobacter iguaniorum]ANE36359.1 glycosyltransferase, family 1 [Campylobacter iguaniorum]